MSLGLDKDSRQGMRRQFGENVNSETMEISPPESCFLDCRFTQISFSTGSDIAVAIPSRDLETFLFVFSKSFDEKGSAGGSQGLTGTAPG